MPRDEREIVELEGQTSTNLVQGFGTNLVEGFDETEEEYTIKGEIYGAMLLLYWGCIPCFILSLTFGWSILDTLGPGNTFHFISRNIFLHLGISRFMNCCLQTGFDLIFVRHIMTRCRYFEPGYLMAKSLSSGIHYENVFIRLKLLK